MTRRDELLELAGRLAAAAVVKEGPVFPLATPERIMRFVALAAALVGAVDAFVLAEAEMLAAQAAAEQDEKAT